MKTTKLGTYIETFMGQYRTWMERYQVQCFSFGFEPMESDASRRIDMYSRFNNDESIEDVRETALFMVNGNTLGYGSFLLLARNNGTDLLAAIISDTTPQFVNIIKALKMFNRVPIKRIVEGSSEYLVVFDY